MHQRPIIFYASIGHGHKQAALALYDELMQQGLRPKMIDTFYTLSPLLHYTLLNSYLGLLKLSPSLWRKLYFHADKHSLYYRIDQLSILFLNRLYKIIRQERPPFVISTHSFVTPFLTTLKIKKQFPLPVYSVITDFMMHPAYLRDGVDRYFTHDPLCHLIAEKYELEKEQFVATGIPVPIMHIREFSKRKLRNELHIPQHLKTVLIAGGGIGLANYVTIIEELEKLSDKVVILCMTGHNKKAFRHLSLMKSKHDLRIIPFTEQFLHYLRASDVIISKSGGLTMAESLICETPIIIFQPVPGHEEDNAQFLLKNGAAICVKQIIELAYYTKQVLYDEKLLARMKSGAKMLQKPQAATHIVENILNQERLRQRAVW